jgi:hypothetical protein
MIGHVSCLIAVGSRRYSTMREVILLAHVVFGVACLLAGVWLFVDVLNARPENLARIRLTSRLVALFMWLALAVGGYWYVANYKTDKELILKGPWPFAHSFFMETKEHFVITLLLLATYLPIAAGNNLATNREARRLVLCVTALVAALALLAEGHGAATALGVKAALLATH